MMAGQGKVPALALGSWAFSFGSFRIALGNSRVCVSSLLRPAMRGSRSTDSARIRIIATTPTTRRRKVRMPGRTPMRRHTTTVNTCSKYYNHSVATHSLANDLRLSKSTDRREGSQAS
jgi:hypothetical protein